MSRVAIIAAMPSELKPLVKNGRGGDWQYERREVPNAPGVDIWRRYHRGDNWIAACAGAGEPAAMRAFAEVEKDGLLTSVISVGWAGALKAEYVPGKAYRVSGVIDSKTGARYKASAAPSELWLVTSPRVADEAEKQRLAAAYSAALVDMEAAVIARLAAMRYIPFQCIKGVSDGVAETIPDFNRFISPMGQFQLAQLLLFVLPRPRYWPALVRMGENSRKASQAIRDLLLENLDASGVIENQNGD